MISTNRVKLINLLPRSSQVHVFALQGEGWASVKVSHRKASYIGVLRMDTGFPGQKAGAKAGDALYFPTSSQNEEQGQ